MNFNKLNSYSLFILFFLLINCKENPIDNKSQSKIENEVIVTGKIKNFNIDSDKSSIAIIINDAVKSGQFTHSSKIDSSGNFRISFKHPYMQEVYLSYNTNFNIIVSNKDSLHIEIDKNELSFFGNLSVLNEHFTKYKELYQKKGMNKSFDQSYSELDFKEFVNYQDSVRQSHLNFRDTFVDINSPSEDLIHWINADIEFSYYRSLFNYPRNHKRIKSLSNEWTIDKNYYTLFSNIHFSKEFLIHGSSYFFITGYYFTCISEPIRIKLEKPTVKKIYEQVFDNLDSLTNSHNKYLKQLTINWLAIEWLKSHEMELYKKYESNIKQIVNEPFLIETIDEMITSKQLLASELEFEGFTSEKSESLWNKIISDNENRVIYLKFWATWCGACRYELPFDENLRKKNKDKPIDFIYLAMESNKDSWKELSSKFNMNSNNYFLDAEQTAYFKGLLSLSGYPTNIIIDKTGKIVLKDNIFSNDPRIQNLLNKLSVEDSKKE